MPEQETEREKDLRRTWARIERGGADAMATSADFGRLALYAYMEERESRFAPEPAESSADLSALAAVAALQKLAHVQAVAAEQQNIGNLLQFAALEGLGIPVQLRQQAAQAAADALGVSESLEDPAAAEEGPG